MVLPGFAAAWPRGVSKQRFARPGSTDRGLKFDVNDTPSPTPPLHRSPIWPKSDLGQVDFHVTVFGTRSSHSPHWQVYHTAPWLPLSHVSKSGDVLADQPWLQDV